MRRGEIQQPLRPTGGGKQRRQVVRDCILIQLTTISVSIQKLEIEIQIYF